MKKCNWFQSVMLVFVCYCESSFSACEDYLAEVPENFNPFDYDVYQGDFNGNGDDGDLYFVAKGKFILIHGDISIPIIVPAPTSFKLTRQWDYNYRRYDNTVESTDKICDGVIIKDSSRFDLELRVAAGEVQKRIFGEDLLVGDFDGDGLNDIFSLSERDYRANYIFHWSSSEGPQLSGSIGSSNYWENFTINVDDVNGDGRDDLVLFRGGTFSHVLLADEDGIFDTCRGCTGNDPALLDEEKRQSILFVWKSFCDEIVAGDVSQASEYVIPAYAEKLAAVSDFLGDELKEVVGQVQGIAPFYIGKDAAVYLIQKIGDDGQFYVHTVTFRRQSGPHWRISDL